MQQFKPLPAIFYAAFSRELYRDAYLRWQGLGLNYLLILNLVMITPTLLMLIISIEGAAFDEHNHLAPEIQVMVEEVVTQIPEMVFEDGQLQTDVAQPHFIYLTSNGERNVFALIDLDAGLIDLQNSKAVMLLTKDAVHAKMGGERIETHFWSELVPERLELNAVVAAQMAQEGAAWLAENKSWLMMLFGLLAWVGTLLVMFLYRAAQALIFGGMALLVAKFMGGVTLPYGDAVRISALALTPPILLDAVFGLLLKDQMSPFLFIAVTVGYLVFAIQSIKSLAEVKH